MKNFIILFFLAISLTDSAFASFRIKDMVTIQGVRDNLLIGYGLVVGLNGTGDNLNNTSFTQKGLIDFLERLGVNTRGANLKTRNIAAVTVTAILPPFSRHGNKIDINVSTLGDAKSLEGGTLLATPLLAADGDVYAVAQGPISISQFVAYNNSVKTKNRSVSTSGSITNGAIIEKEIDFSLNSLNKINLSLNNPDVTTSMQIAKRINRSLNGDFAKSLDPGTVEVTIPREDNQNTMQVLSKIEQIKIYPDQAAKIIIEESSGTIVIGENVAISPVAISQGNLSLQISSGKSTDFPFASIAGGVVSSGVNPVVGRGEKVALLEGTTNLGELVEGLNNLGVGPRDLISLLQNMRQIGALQAQIEVR